MAGSGGDAIGISENQIRGSAGSNMSHEVRNLKSVNF